MQQLPAANPFSTRFTRPGAIDFLFPAGMDGARLLERLRLHGWWGQIVGPHGSGKSTLLAALEPHWESVGREPLAIVLRDGQRQLDWAALSDRRLGPRSQLIIDGYEQLSWWSRYRVKRLCRLHRSGLLITSHRTAGFPELFTTRVDLATAARLVEIVGRSDSGALPKPPIEVLLAEHGGNMRELFFALYDWYEQHRL
jgi:hypothetical protein